MKPTIGIEVHVELKSMAKVFSLSKNNFNDEANTNINVIDLGYPGVLPRLNKGVIDDALKACLALNFNINRLMHFDRKNYFYPDLPKGYQITQQDTPIGYDGYVEISNKKIYLERMHIEEDTCKSLHTTDTLLNFNRAGVPLLEIVTKPCISSGKEAVEYLEKLRETLLYLGISDVKIEEGSMRCDVNVSVSDTDELGTKVEVKNIGSISNVGVAIDYEIQRQEELLANGEVIIEQTRRFDDKSKTTILMRYKETGNDYRYFPEPDIPFVILEDAFIENAIATIPKLPDELREIYQEKGLSKTQAEKIIANRSLSAYFNQFIKRKTNYTLAANLLLGDVAAYLNKKNTTIDKTNLTFNRLQELIEKIEDGSLSSKNTKEILEMVIETDTPIEVIMKEKGIQNIKDDSIILQVIEKVMQENEASVKDYLDGKDRAFKYLMGQVMKETKGSVNPKKANDLLKEKLKERSV